MVSKEQLKVWSVQLEELQDVKDRIQEVKHGMPCRGKPLGHNEHT